MAKKKGQENDSHTAVKTPNHPYRGAAEEENGKDASDIARGHPALSDPEVVG